MKAVYIFILLLCATTTYAEDDQLSAKDILKESIEFCGYSPKNKTGISYKILLPDSTTIVVDEKRQKGKKLTLSLLSHDYNGHSSFFDGKRITSISNDKITHSTNEMEVEKSMLQTYTHLPVGYRDLKYKLERLPDKKFKNFSCYVLKVTSKKGYTTINFFDKRNFRLIMVLHPNDRKTLYIEYEFINGSLINTHIINTIPNSDDLRIMTLIKYNYEGNFSDLWFKCPYKDKVEVPDFIKEGKFQSTSGPDTWFTRDASKQNYYDPKDKNKHLLTRHLKWSKTDEMGLVTDGKEDEIILVRIISWDSKGYVCHWIAGPFADDQDYVIEKE